MVLVISGERPVPVEPRGTARRLGTAETGATLRPKRVAAKVINPPNEPIPAGMANGRCGAWNGWCGTWNEPARAGGERAGRIAPAI